jgi:WD40 repeat protein
MPHGAPRRAKGHYGGVMGCAFAPDGGTLASADNEGSARLWDPASGECRAVL